MKKIILIIAIPVFIALFFYLVFAFGAWSLNPGTWDSFARGICAILIGCLTLGFYLFVAQDID